MSRYQRCGEETGWFVTDLGLTLDLGMEEASETRSGLFSSDDMPLEFSANLNGLRMEGIMCCSFIP